MIFLNEHQKKLNELYDQLSDLKEGKKIIENTMHSNFYNRGAYQHLFDKLLVINEKIKQTKIEIQKERKLDEKSRKNI